MSSVKLGISIGLLGLVALVGLAIWSGRPVEGEVRLPDLGNEHIESIDSEHAGYNSVPPTSGPHIGGTAEWGIHQEPIPNEIQVHNLEDGGIMVQYRPDLLSSDEIAELERVSLSSGSSHVAVAPYPDMDYPIALTAWTRLLPMEVVDQEIIGKFIRNYEGLDHHSRY